MNNAHKKPAHIRKTILTSLGMIMLAATTIIFSSVVRADEQADKQRAVNVVKGFIHCLETGNTELCLNLMGTPYFLNGQRIVLNMSELRTVVESTMAKPSKIGLVEYSITDARQGFQGKFGEAHIDVMAKAGNSGFLFRVRPGDTFKIIGISAI